MEVKLHYKNLTKRDEERFHDYLSSKLNSIQSLLTKFSKDAVILKASAEKFDKHDAYQVELHLTLPAKSLVATEASHDLTKAVDFSKSRLLVQIKKHMAHLRNDRQHQSIRKQTAPAAKLETKEELEV